METPTNYFTPDGPVQAEELARAVEAYFAADDEHARTGSFAPLVRALSIRKKKSNESKTNQSNQSNQTN